MRISCAPCANVKTRLASTIQVDDAPVAMVLRDYDRATTTNEKTPATKDEAPPPRFDCVLARAAEQAVVHHFPTLAFMNMSKC